jgi:NAD(P)-dependent dehydrogenase (short-subunit alcohol dehydrogenase family)
MSLKAQRVLVIGGASGIGRAIALGAVAEGANVVIASTNADKLSRAAAEMGPSASTAVLNVADEASVERFFATSGSFDHIANTAGDWEFPPPGPLSQLDLAAAAKTLNVRYWGAIAVAKHGATKLNAGGSYTLTGGMLAHVPAKGQALFTALAGGIEFLARGLAVDLAPIRVNCVAPGLIQTEQWALLPEAYAARLLEGTKRQLLARPGTPAEAAEAYLYCMRNTFATGQVIQVAGGVELAR